jgi:uncharacterized membrane protein
VTLLITGTRMSGCVLRQNDTIDTQMKNTDMTPIICNLERRINGKLNWFVGVSLGLAVRKVERLGHVTQWGSCGNGMVLDLAKLSGCKA